MKNGPTVAEFWGAPQDSEEESMSSARPERPRRREAGGVSHAATTCHICPLVTRVSKLTKMKVLENTVGARSSVHFERKFICS